MKPIGPKVFLHGLILLRTKSCGTRCYVATVGDVSAVARCRIWKSTTISFAAIRVRIPP
jgi:hypothetical protein